MLIESLRCPFVPQVCRRAERSVVALARSTTSEADASDASTTSRNNANRTGGEKDAQAAQGEGDGGLADEKDREGNKAAEGKEGDGQLQKGGPDVQAAEMGIPSNSVVDAAVVVYINRLSDYFFTAARYMVRWKAAHKCLRQRLLTVHRNWFQGRMMGLLARCKN